MDATNSDAPTTDAVVFDLGGVFFDWDPRHLYRKLIQDEEQLEWFLSEICTPEWHAEQDLGRNTVESCNDLATRHPEYADLIGAWALRGEEMIAGLFHESIAILTELRRQEVPCYALSNMEPETFVHRRTRYPFLSEFDGFVISGFEGVAKPDEAIFRVLLQRFGLDPGRTLLFDDRQVNVDAGLRLGFDAYRFTSPAALRARLVERGLLLQCS